jgi:very-short-patch-repair endonuclease
LSTGDGSTSDVVCVLGHDDTMDDWMHAADRHGIASVAELRGAGIERRAVVSMVKNGTLTPLAHGWYAVGPIVDDEERHLLATRAMLRSHGGRAVAGHHSGLLVLGMPTLGADLEVVRLSRRTPGPTRTTPSLRLGRSVPVEMQRAETVAPAFAAVQDGLSASPLSALVAADGILRAGLGTGAEISAAVGLVMGHPDSAGIAGLLQNADGRHESPGETRVAYALRLLGIGATPQVSIPGSHAVVDFVLDEAPVIIEFDGRVKYGRGAQDRDPFGRRQTGQDVLWQEKRREDRLRDLGYEVVRVIWSDLDSPRELEARIRRAIDRSRTVARMG